MPTAMVSMHKDAVLSASSAKTAERGKRILKSLKDKPAVTTNVAAIYAAASTNSGETNADPSLVEVGVWHCTCYDL